MMKKTLLVVATLFSAMFAQAKEITIKFKGYVQDGQTRIYDNSSAASDTLTVHPGKGVALIDVTLKTVTGAVIESYRVPATWEDCLYIISPEITDGFLLEVRDDKGVYYTKFED